MKRALAAGIVAVAVVGAVAVALARRGRDEGARCGPGFAVKGARCEVPVGACPAPLVSTTHGCDAPDVRVLIAAAAIAVGPSDWEAQGRVLPRSIRVQAFRVDAFEVTRGRMGLPGDPARAASGVTRAEASAFCDSQGGRLPTEDEWIVAAASGMNPPRRYPWGDTGAVCRRAAWGLVTGPCAEDAREPDTVGAHPDGDTPLGLHDLAGNVAEWVAGEPAAAKGGSFADALASELRLWARLEAPEGGRDPRIGLRCVYPP